MPKQKEMEKIVWSEVYELKKINVPTLKEKIEKGISDKDWIMTCYEANKKRKCVREINGHSLCDLCPKRNR